MNTSESSPASFRMKIYIGSAAMVIIALIIAAFTNWKNQLFTLSLLQLGVCAFLLLTMYYALKNQYIEIFSEIISYLVAVMLLFNATQLSSNDPGPFFGLIALLNVSALLNFRMQRFVLYAITIYITYLGLWTLQEFSLGFAAHIKFQAVYIALMVVIILHKHYLDIKNDSLILETETMKKQAQTIESEKVIAQKHAASYKERELKLAEQKKQLEELNALMIGREQKMIELKKEIAQLRSQPSPVQVSQGT